MKSFKHIEERAQQAVQRLSDVQCRRLVEAGAEGVVLALPAEDELDTKAVAALRAAIIAECCRRLGLQRAG